MSTVTCLQRHITSGMVTVTCLLWHGPLLLILANNDKHRTSKNIPESFLRYEAIAGRRQESLSILNRSGGRTGSESTVGVSSGSTSADIISSIHVTCSSSLCCFKSSCKRNNMTAKCKINQLNTTSAKVCIRSV